MLLISAHTSAQSQTGIVYFFKASLVYLDVWEAGTGLVAWPAPLRLCESS